MELEDIDSFLTYEDKDIISNEDRLRKTFRNFEYKVNHDIVVIDKSGVKTVEILGWQCRDLNPWQPLLNFNGKGTSINYCKEELQWYLSQDLSVEKIGEVAKIWKQICSTDGKVNSNYGWCIFSKENYSQFENVLNELIKHPDSRRATMIFTRPSMWEDYNKDGMNDFICTWGVHCFIRDKQLYYIVNQRSCDIWFGLRNDFAFHCYIYQTLFGNLKAAGIDLEKSKDGIIYNCDTIHMYERHFNLLDTILKEGDV